MTVHTTAFEAEQPARAIGAAKTQLAKTALDRRGGVTRTWELF
jgi:hypothetical protein